MKMETVQFLHGINVGNVQKSFRKTANVSELLCFSFRQQSDLLGRGTKTTWLRLEKYLFFWSPQTQLETSIVVTTNATGNSPEISIKSPSFVTRNMTGHVPNSRGLFL